MWIRRLRIEDLRCFESAELDLAPGFNAIFGPNGAGKTTLIEAAFLLSYARSFRSGGRASLVRRGRERFVIHAEVELEGGRTTRVGLLQARDGQSEGRLDGRVIPRLSELVTHIAVCCFEPGSHELIGGGGEHRRTFLDWGLFHVEQDFLATWRRTQRALRQRNALLRSAAAPERELEVWDQELAEHGARMTRERRAELAALEPLIARNIAAWVPELGAMSLGFQSGWSGGDEAEDLARELAAHRERDRSRGHTTVGPQRADWSLAFQEAPRREQLSRGQEKLVALACILAQAERHALRRGEWPILCFDDLASELDAVHRQRVLAAVEPVGAQILVTGTELESFRTPGAKLFHVEHHRVASPEGPAIGV